LKDFKFLTVILHFAAPAKATLQALRAGDLHFALIKQYEHIKKQKIGIHSNRAISRYRHHWCFGVNYNRVG